MKVLNSRKQMAGSSSTPYYSASKRRSGQAVLEMAVVIPALLGLLIGIMEIGWLVKNNMTLASAAREGTRWAALGRTNQEVTQRIQRYANPIRLTTNDISLQQCDSTGQNCTLWQQCDNTGQNCTVSPANDTSVSPARNGIRPPNMVRVVVTSRHQSLTGFIPGLNGRILTTTVTMRREA